jgi:RHS repeat-associated protein
MLVTLFLAAPAQAEEVWWEFSTTFPDGSIAEGYFILDSTKTGAERVVEWDIVTQAGPGFTAGDYWFGYDETIHTVNDYVGFEDRTGSPGNFTQRDFFLSVNGVPATIAQSGVEHTVADQSSGEVLFGTPSGAVFRRLGAFIITGYRMSDQVEEDVEAEGGRLDEVAQAGNPVNLLDGAFTYNAILMEDNCSAEPFKFQVYYDSRSTDLVTGGVGKKWTHSYEYYLVVEEDPEAGDDFDHGRIEIVRGDRAADYFDFEVDDMDNVTIEPAFPQSRTKLEYTPETSEGADDDYLTYTDHKGNVYFFDLRDMITVDGAGRQGGELYVGPVAEVQDRNGRSSLLEYDNDGFLTRVVGPEGNRIATFTYDAQGCMRRIDYKEGTTTLMQVDLGYDNQNLTSFCSPTNPDLTARFTYDGESNLLTGTAGTGAADDFVFVNNTYSDVELREMTALRVVSQRDDNGNETKFAYEDLTGGESRTTVTDPRGSVSTRTFDRSGRIAGAQNSSGNTFDWEYDENGNLETTKGPIDGAQDEKRIEYTPGGSVECMINEEGDTLDFEWGSGGTLTSLTQKDSAGNDLRSEYEYDENGNMTCFRNQNGECLFFEHDSEGRLTKTTDFTGREFENSYNGAGELSEIKTPTGSVRYGYDSMGRVNSVTNRNGNTRSMTYDSSGALSSVRAPNGDETKLTNDAFGRITRQESPGGVSVDYERNRKGDITATIDAEGNRFEYDYDEMGRISAKRDPMGVQTTFRHHSNGQLDQTTDSLGNTATATFNAAGQKETVTDPNGNVTRYAYDRLGRVTSMTDPLGRAYNNEYDPAGNVTRITNGRGQDIALEYDNTGALTQLDCPDKTITYTLDEAGRRTESRQDDAAGTLTTRLSFDPNSGLVSSRTDAFGNVIRYAHDADGNLTALTYSDGKTVSYTYDQNNRMTSVTDWNGRKTIYTYTMNGARADLPDGSSVTYEYNKCGRLVAMTDVAASGATNFAGRWTYDGCGRTVRAERSLPLEPSEAPQSTAIVYDAAGQVTSVNGAPFTYDADGNLINGTIDGVATTITYDCQNRITQYNSDSYRYDAEGLRIEATRGGQTTRQVWDPVSARTHRLLEEHDANGNIIRRYVHGIGLVAQENAASGAMSVYHFDKRGSTVALTNANGDITDRYAYGAYGACVTREGSTPNPFTYNGRDGVIDDGNGTYNTEFRLYISSLARFAQKDPVYKGILTRPASLNRYAFGEGNPIDFIDPSGRGLFSAVGGVVGGAVGGLVQMTKNVIEKKPLFRDVAGAALTGALTGAAVGAGPVGMIALSGLASGAGNLLNQGIAVAEGRRTNFDAAGFAEDVAVGAATGGIMAKVGGSGAAPTSAFKNIGSKVGSYARTPMWSAVKTGARSAANYMGEVAAGEAVDYGARYAYNEAGKIPGYAYQALDSGDVTRESLQRTQEYGDTLSRDDIAGCWGLYDHAPSYEYGENYTNQVGDFDGYNYWDEGDEE